MVLHQGELSLCVGTLQSGRKCTRRQRQTVTLADAGLRLLVAPFGVSHQQHHWRSTGSPPPPRCSVAPTRRRGPCSRQQRGGRTWSAFSRHTRSQYAAEMARLLQHHQRLGTTLVCLGVPLVACRPQPDHTGTPRCWFCMPLVWLVIEPALSYLHQVRGQDELPIGCQAMALHKHICHIFSPGLASATARPKLRQPGHPGSHQTAHNTSAPSMRCRPEAKAAQRRLEQAKAKQGVCMCA